MNEKHPADLGLQEALNTAYRTMLDAVSRGDSDERVTELRTRFARLERMVKSRRTTVKMLAPVLSR